MNLYHSFNFFTIFPSDNHYYEKFEKSGLIDITDDIPFDIPFSWQWIRICNCADVYTGNSISESIKTSKYTGLKEGYNYIGTKDVNFDNTINYENGVKIPFEETKFRNAYKDNTLICVEGGSAGRKVAKISEDVCFGNKLATINSWIVNPDYIYLVFQSSIIQNFFKSNMTGIIGGVSINKLKTIIIPIPPLDEQERIVNKYKSFIPLINSYDEKYCKIENLNNNYKEELKKSILQYAIQGKLVKQDLNDEPAEILINTILNEKRELIKTKQIKKENLSVIYKDPTDNQFYEKFDDGKVVNITDEISLEIPNSWRWVRLKSISTLISDGTHKTPKYVSSGIPFISVKDISSGILNFKNTKYITSEEHIQLIKRCKPEKNDVLICRIGTLGKALKIDTNIEFSIFVSLGLIKLIDIRLADYIVYVINSTYGFNWIEKYKVGGGTHTFKINLENLREMLIPVPPLNEQNKIVSKTKQLFDYIK